MTDSPVAAAEIARLFGAIGRLFQSSRQKIGQSDVTPRMLAVLRHLANPGPMTVGELARHLGVGRATVSELIDRLEGRDLVERMRDERDQRRVFLWLTREGRRRVDELATEPLDDRFAAAVASLSPETRSHITAGLQALLKAADENPNDQRR